MLHNFYAVTVTTSAVSLYKVCSTLEERVGNAVAEKIDLRGSSKMPIGGKIGSAMIAVCDTLIPFIPEGGSTSFQRKIELVNTGYWGISTSPIVALFLREEEARKCFTTDDAQPRDRRWIEQTKEVLKAIGDDSPHFVVCHFPSLALLPDEPVAAT